MVKKTKEKGNRDSKGRWKKGKPGGPGRRKGEPKDIVCQDGKTRSPAALVNDLLSTYGKMGSNKLLYKWAMRSHGNLTKFIDLLFKFAPMPTVESSMEFKPLTIQIQKLPEDDAYKLMEENIKQLKDDNREMSLELVRMKSIFDSHSIEYTEISHEVIRDELPSHDEVKAKDDEEKEEREYVDKTDRGKD